MTVPYNGEAREAYVLKWTEHHLHVAEAHHALGNEVSMWLSLINYAMAEEIYGGHWDYVSRLKEKNT